MSRCNLVADARVQVLDATELQMHQACVLQLPIGLDATELQMQRSLKTRFRYTEKLTSHTHDKPLP